jgi:DNA-binding beta-propeller fold protein YncE
MVRKPNSVSIIKAAISSLIEETNVRNKPSNPLVLPFRRGLTSFLIASSVVACSGGGGGSSSIDLTPVVIATIAEPTQAEVEKSIGTLLQKPVMQCGSGVDTVTGDSSPGSIAIFESGPVRPLTLSKDGLRLYVVNAPANCLEVYAVEGDTLRLTSTIAVGLEPVAVAERADNEVWVVNHLSDSVSVVRLDGTPRVLRTLLVGDEPRDIVFAGVNRDRAFITAAARGQNRPGNAALTTPSLGRADVWVFDTKQLDDSLNGKPLAILNLFADTPRALAVSSDGKTVYAAPLFSGNGSTVLHRDALQGAVKAGPTMSADNVVAPATGLIVKYDGNDWRDAAGALWTSKVKLSLPDYDVFEIDANSTVPTLGKKVSGVGTSLFNMAVHPTTGKLYVSNTDAINHIRFEGPGLGSSSVRGRVAESRISVVDVQTGAVDPVHLNSHIDFSLAQGQSTAPLEKAKSLSQPLAMVFSANGDTLFTAMYGSAKVAALKTASLSKSTFVPNVADHIAVPAGPAGLALNAAGTRLYVYSRIAHSLSVIDLATKASLSSTNLFTPEPSRVVSGRRLMYDAVATSSNGTAACSSCHVFSDLDQLAWDLGNPNEATTLNPNAYLPLSPRTTPRFHPLKGPMTTQTLKGMANNGPMHWRGDRTGTARQVVRGALETLEEAAFKEFNSAFVELVGREAPLSADQMQSLTDFTMLLALPPNPVRKLDNSLTATEQTGRDIYFNSPTTLLGSCNNCHRLDPVNKRFGTAGLMTFEGGRITENFKIPQLRNMYQKVGMFGSSLSPAPATGPQVRGFGFSNDGASDTLDTFLSDPVFTFPAPAPASRAAVAAFVLALDSDLAPVVGQQITWRSTANAAVEAQLALLKEQALVTSPRAACDLVVRASIDGVSKAGLFQADGTWLMRSGETLSDANLRQLASATQALTFMCVMPGSGRRIALNKN